MRKKVICFNHGVKSEFRDVHIPIAIRKSKMDASVVNDVTVDNTSRLQHTSINDTWLVKYIYDTKA